MASLSAAGEIPMPTIACDGRRAAWSGIEFELVGEEESWPLVGGEACGTLQGSVSFSFSSGCSPDGSALTLRG